MPLVKSNLFQRIKKPPYIVVSHAIAPTTYGGRESKFGFVAVFRTENELGIVENISVDCKGDSTYGYNLFLTIEIADDDNKNHL
ncbi:MAG: hypothetical protein IIV14_01625, partial [Bacteroidaceae bacterium]|nr:hypothetical protein [Bacteroidaceae bacterium]